VRYCRQRCVGTRRGRLIADPYDHLRQRSDFPGGVAHLYPQRRVTAREGFRGTDQKAELNGQRRRGHKLWCPKRIRGARPQLTGIYTKGTSECVERGGNCRARGKVGNIESGNAAVVTRTGYSSPDRPRGLDLQIRQYTWISTATDDGCGSGLGIIVPWPGLDHQLKSRSGTALEYRYTAGVDRDRWVH